MNDDWNDKNKLIYNITNCINIENNITNINEINEAIKRYNSQKINFKFLTDEKQVKRFLVVIQDFMSKQQKKAK